MIRDLTAWQIGALVFLAAFLLLCAYAAWDERRSDRRRAQAARHRAELAAGTPVSRCDDEGARP